MNNTMNNITGLVVSYNTRELLELSIVSVRTFYPDMNIIIIDGSTKDNDCYSYVRSIAQTDRYITPVSVGFNIGHGPGMDLGISICKTDHIMIFDSDIIMKKPPVEEMLELFEKDTFGVGEIRKADAHGRHYVSFENIEYCLYLHPYFQIISKHQYYKFHPYIHHGAPCNLAMWDIWNNGLSEKILKEFPVAEYIEHKRYGTRDLNPKEYGRNWENKKLI